jgi:hypothetical protein
MAQYAAAFTGSNFVLASDGHGGTMVEFTSATIVAGAGGGGHGHG